MILVGELELQLPDARRRGTDREVEIVFDFSHTEIQVRAFDKSSQAEVKTVLDFLSSRPAQPAVGGGRGAARLGEGEGGRGGGGEGGGEGEGVSRQREGEKQGQREAASEDCEQVDRGSE